MSSRPPLTALLIVKGHSSRVPGKNFRPLNGVPLVHYILKTLAAAPDVGRVVIDTDARARLAAIGVRATPGTLDILDRAPALRGDAVTANTLIADMLGHVAGERFLMTHATSPFLTPDTIARAVARFDAAAAEDGADSLLTVTTHHARFYDDAGAPLNHDPRDLVPTQSLPAWYQENSALYLFTRASFAATGGRIGAQPVLFPISRVEALDIDTPDDWALAEAVARGTARPYVESSS